MDDWSLLSEVDVISKLSEDFNKLLESKKWLDRRDALQSLLDLITSNPRLDPKANYDEITNSLHHVLAKDANVNVCAVAAKCITGIARGLRSKFAPYASMYVPVIFERLKEKRNVLKDPLVECVDAIASTVNLDNICEDFASSISKPNPQTKLQGCNFVYRSMLTFKQENAPKKFIKTVTPVVVKLSMDPDAEVREAAFDAIGSLSRLTGEKVMKTFLGNIQDDKLKLKKIDEAKEKAVIEAHKLEGRRTAAIAPAVNVTAAAQFLEVNTCQATVSGTVVPEMDPFDLMDPVDVLAKLPPTFMQGVESNKWIERRDALQALLSLCTENPKLCPKASYGEHIMVLKKILEKDSNINVCALAARCLTAIASGLRKKFSPYASTVTPVIFDKFKEKKPLLRDPLIDCIDAVAASTSMEALVDDIHLALEKQNPNIKIQADLFLYRTFKRLTVQTMPKKVLKTISPLLVKHTGDGDPEVRDAAYAALGAVMKVIGEKPCFVLISEIVEDKMKIGKIKEFCEKAIQEAGPDVVSVMVQSIHKSNPVVQAESVSTASDNAQVPLKPPAPGVGSKTDVLKKLQSCEYESEEAKENKEPVEDIASAPGPEVSAKPRNEIMKANKEKIIRLKDEKSLKLLKWNFDHPTEEHIEQLQGQLASVTNPTFHAMLFHKDFKQHLKAIDMIQSLIKDDSECVISSSDLILKWITLRFFETNPIVLMKVLELATSIFELLHKESEPYSDIELISFCPYLILKMGEPKDSVRNSVSQIINHMANIVHPPKMYPFIFDGLKSKNSRQRVECLKVVDKLVEFTGVSSMPNPSQSLKQVASYIGDRDNNVRNAAISAIVTVYKEEGDRVFHLIGKMNEKDRSMLDERIKRIGIVSKAAGGPEKTGYALGQRPRSRSRMNLAVRGRRGESEVRGDNPEEDRPESRAESNSEENRGRNGENCLNRTFDVGGELEEAMKRRSDIKPLARCDLNNVKVRRFTLNVAEIIGESHPGLSYTLKEISDDSLNPIEPLVRNKPQRTPFSHRTESVSSINSLDSSCGDIDKTIAAVSSVSHDVSNAAINQLQYLFHDQTNCRYIAERANKIVQALVAQFCLIRSRTLSNEACERIRSMGYLIRSMIAETSVILRVETDSLKMVFQEFLYLLKDPRIALQSSGAAIVRSLNFLTVRLCDSADPTSCFLALCAVLTETLRDPNPINISDLSIKCILKQSELFLQDLPLNIDAVFAAIHNFMKEFKPQTDGSDSCKAAMQALQLCIQRLVSKHRASMLNHLMGVPDPDKSEAVIYMNRCLRSLKSAGQQSGASSLQSSTYGELPGQVQLFNQDDELWNYANKLVSNPTGKYMRVLHDYMAKNSISCQTFDLFLKKHERKREFINYHLKKMDLNEDSLPKVSEEYSGMHEQVLSVSKKIQNFRQTGEWNKQLPQPQEASAVSEPTTKVPKRHSSISKSVMVEGAPENETNTEVLRKRNITSSDLEPLRQRLLSMRRRQEEH